MHQDIEKLLNTAKEKGYITEKQREIILNKAQQLGEDMAEVEFVLEDIPLKKDITEKAKTKKCPHCGAFIIETLLSCPECGYVFQNENAASKEAKVIIDDLKYQLNDAAKPLSKLETLWNPNLSIERQVNVINSFILPTTKEGLMLLLEFAYSNYIAIGNNANDYIKKPIKNAWHSKAIQAINMLSRLGNDSLDIKTAIEKYNTLLRAEKKKWSYGTKIWLGLGIMMALIIFGGYRGCQSENKERVANEVKECLANNDYQCAKMAVNKLSGKDKELLYDEIVVQEVTYLISKKEFEQAAAVTMTMYSPSKQQRMLNTINASKK